MPLNILILIQEYGILDGTFCNKQTLQGNRQKVYEGENCEGWWVCVTMKLQTHILTDESTLYVGPHNRGKNKLVCLVI